MGQSNQHNNSKAASNTINETQDLLNKIEQNEKFSSEDLNKISEQIKNIKADLQLPKGYKESNAENPNDSNDSENNTNKRELNTQLKNIENDLEKMQGSSKFNSEFNKESLKNLQKNLNQLSETIKAQEQASNISNNSPETKPTTSTAAKEDPKEDVVKPIPEKKPSPLINEELLKQFLNFLKTIIIAGMVFLLLAFLNKFFKKTKYEDLERINPNAEDEIELKIELNTLKNLKLNPREEVIMYYEFIYKIIKFYHFPDQEAPPPTEACHQIVNKHLIIKKQLFTVDEIFSRCFYGNHEVTKDQLILFRKSIPDILVRFGLKKKLFQIG